MLVDKLLLTTEALHASEARNRQSAASASQVRGAARPAGDARRRCCCVCWLRARLGAKLRRLCVLWRAVCAGAGAAGAAAGAAAAR